MDENRQDELVVAELSYAFSDPADVVAVGELAAAERAVAQGTATAEQRAGCSAAAGLRRPEDRIRAWRESREKWATGHHHA